jgi:outer membrane protein assembly factor BamE (lipoprotein component of BamABCDE complex)
MIPIPAPEKLIKGKEIEQEQLDFLALNVTTKEEVIKHLGQPT